MGGTTHTTGPLPDRIDAGERWWLVKAQAGVAVVSLEQVLDAFKAMQIREESWDGFIELIEVSEDLEFRDAKGGVE